MSYLVGVLIALPIGIYSAYRQYSWFDQIGTFMSMVGFSVPTFFTGRAADRDLLGQSGLVPVDL
jgi:peptide/nickel transport system permease protein